jgi:hypothetical protein
MLASSIVWILVGSGGITAIGGLAAVLAPRPLLRVAFGVETVDATMTFFVRHWGVLIFVVGSLLVYSAYYPMVRAPVLTGAAIEKLAVGVLILFGRVRRTPVIVTAAVADGIFAVLYISYLAGL